MNRRTHARMRLAPAVAALVAAGAAAPVTTANAEDRPDRPGASVTSSTGATRTPDLTAPCTGSGMWSNGSCASESPTVGPRVYFTGDTTACTFEVTIDWGDGSAPETSTFTGGADGTDRVVGTHTYNDEVRPSQFDIGVSGRVVSGSCWFSSGVLTFRLVCEAADLSGAAWARRFRGSADIADLEAPFRGDVRSFVAAMRQAGITVAPVATYRPPQRAYMMHYSWRIGRGLSADEVPPFVPREGEDRIGICWVHPSSDGTADLAASTAGARALAGALGIDPTLADAPALRSRHTARRAIDMRTTWRGTVTIQNANGRRVRIESTPRTGLNRQLINVGATYGVIHFINAVRDRNHWSDNGR